MSIPAQDVSATCPIPARARWTTTKAIGAYGRAFWDHTEPLKPDEEDYIRSHPLIMFQLALGVTDLRGLRCLRRGLTLRANALQRKSYRSRYYDRENASRRALAAERRKIRRRTTTNPCPTPDGFREAFARVGESAEAKIRFGGMVHDLACYVDSCLRYDESGNIVGRNGGIKEWLADNVPELYPRYKTIMRYKALAMRVRQMAGINDPQPTSALLDEVTDGEPTKLKNYSAQKSHITWKNVMIGRRERLEQIRKRLRGVMAECRNTFKDVFDKIDSELGQGESELEKQNPNGNDVKLGQGESKFGRDDLSSVKTRRRTVTRRVAVTRVYQP